MTLVTPPPPSPPKSSGDMLNDGTAKVVYYKLVTHLSQRTLTTGLVRELTRHCCSPTVLAYRDDHHLTLLHHACRHQASLDVVQVLLDADIIAAQDKDGWTPLHFACANQASHHVVQHLLLEQHDNTDSLCRQLTHKGYIALHMACAYHASGKVVQLLLQVWPESISYLTNKGETPLQLACAFHASLPVVRALLQCCEQNNDMQVAMETAMTHNASAEITEALWAAWSARQGNHVAGNGTVETRHDCCPNDNDLHHLVDGIDEQNQSDTADEQANVLQNPSSVADIVQIATARDGNGSHDSGAWLDHITTNVSSVTPGELVVSHAHIDVNHMAALLLRDRDVQAVQQEKWALLCDPDRADVYVYMMARLRESVAACIVLSSRLVAKQDKTLRCHLIAAVQQEQTQRSLLGQTTMRIVQATVQHVMRHGLGYAAPVPGAALAQDVMRTMTTLIEQCRDGPQWKNVSVFAGLAAVRGAAAHRSLDDALEGACRVYLRAAWPDLQRHESFHPMKSKALVVLGVKANTPAKEAGEKVANKMMACLLEPPLNSVLHQLLHDPARQVPVDLSTVLAGAALGLTTMEQLQELGGRAIDPRFQDFGAVDGLASVQSEADATTSSEDATDAVEMADLQRTMGELQKEIANLKLFQRAPMSGGQYDVNAGNQAFLLDTSVLNDSAGAYSAPASILDWHSREELRRQVTLLSETVAQLRDDVNRNSEHNRRADLPRPDRRRWSRKSFAATGEAASAHADKSKADAPLFDSSKACNR